MQVGAYFNKVRIARSLVSVLILTLVQTFSAPILLPEIASPKAEAVTNSYTPAQATSWTVPANVNLIEVTLKGGSGGIGGIDCGQDCVSALGGPRGVVTYAFAVTAGDVIGVYPGRKGVDGTTGLLGGQDTTPLGTFDGGNGGDKGDYGGSGRGGGGGAASVLTINSTIRAVAGGAGGGGGSANIAGSGTDGAAYSGSSIVNGSYTGGSGLKPVNTNCSATQSDSGRIIRDGGGGGGGGGGWFAGAGGGLYIPATQTSECAGYGGSRGGNYLKDNSSAETVGSAGTSETVANTDGSIEITYEVRAVVSTETDTAINLSGSQFLSASRESAFDISTGTTFTLEAWVKPAVTNANQILIGKDQQYSLIIDASGSFGGNFFTTNTPSGTGGASGLFGTASVRPNQWQHVALVRSGTTFTGFINGQQVGSISNSSATDSIKAGSNSFVVGGYSATNQPFTGELDQVRIWSSARTVGELQSSMHEFLPTSQTNLIASYGINESVGSTIFNNSSAAHSDTDLTLNTGSPNWRQVVETSTSEAYSISIFKRSYLTSIGGWKVPAGVTQASALVLGGGGGGGPAGGGGGAGGFVFTAKTTLTPNQVETITVGQGGPGGRAYLPLDTRGANGQDSKLGNRFIAVGGGGGAGFALNARSGGSGGGAAANSASGSTTVAGSSTQYSTYGYGSGNNGGNGRGTTANGYDPGGGGGGAGSAGSTAIADGYGAHGGSGIIDPIGGSTTCFAGGGGGGAGNVSTRAGSGGTCAGGTKTAADGVLNLNAANSASANSGSGGGGSGWSTASSENIPGGNGGSGIIIIRWITASAPTYTPPIAVDTTTAGIRKTFQMSGSANSPLIRNYTWQFSSDTQTTWTTLQASTSDSYTTTTLETTTSGSRYSYRVIVTDSDTAGLSISDSSTFTLVINPRITITGSSVSLAQKYGETQTVTYTIANGTGTRTTVASPNNRTGITWSSVSGDSATIGIGPGLGFGTYYETLTVTDSVTATTTQMITISISKADTITVTMNSPSALNYTGSIASFTPSVNFTGLKNSDTATASSVTLTQTRAGNNCAMGGTCSIGDRGPGGGIVFITPSTVSGNGKYFEAAPDAWYGANDLSSVGKFCTAASSRDNTNEGATQYGIGWGETNTAIFMANCTGGAVKLASDYRGGGFSDWFVPNKNELAEMAKIPTTVDLNNVSGYWGYWSSTEDGSGPASTMSSLTSSSWTMGAVSKSDSTHNMVRPVRMFTPCNAVDSCTAFASTTMPTNAGTYRLTPSALSLSSGDLANYQGVTYASGLLTINKVSQTPIKIGQYDAYPGVSTYPLNVYGGSGTGVMRRTLTTSGSASCVLSNLMFITAANPGTCEVRVTKAADFNYLAAEATATIYWIQFQTNYANGAAGGATGITLTGETAIEKRTYETFTVLSFADETGTAVTSIRANTKLRVIGTGFVAADGTTEVYFGMASVPHSGLTFNTLDPMANYVLLTVPADAETDRVLMYSAKGWATSPGTLTILP